MLVDMYSNLVSYIYKVKYVCTLSTSNSASRYLSEKKDGI